SSDLLGVQPRAGVRQIVSGDAGDRGVAQAHPGDALGDPSRFVGVVCGGLPGVDLAEVAAPCALRAADEEGRLAVLPALVDVGAAGLLAHGVQILLLHEGVQGLVFRPHLRLGADPLGLSLDRRGCVTDLQAQQSAPLRCCGGHAAAPSLVAVAYSAAKPSATACTMSMGETSAPTTSLTVVTPASVIPHGMMPSNPASVLSQLMAKPCMVTPCCTRTPM